MLELLKQPILPVLVTASKQASPPPGYRWLILNGTISHITGTDTSLYIRRGAVNVSPIGYVDDGRGSGPYNACAVNGIMTAAEERLSFNSRMLLLSDAEEIFIAGGSGVNANILVIQFKV